jgi:predicted NAD-dependent protein-ADP-ribosyltransferase YbiA (DUF1768 family)
MEIKHTSNEATEREPINVRLRGEYGQLSNLAESNFSLDSQNYASVEAFIQAIKIPENDPRRVEAMTMTGVKAKFVAHQENQSIEATLKAGELAYVYYQGEQIEYRSIEHLELIETAIRAKFDQNDAARELLISTGDTEFIHQPSRKAESPYTSLPATAFCLMLTQLRDEYIGEAQNEIEEASLLDFTFTPEQD